MQEYSLNDLRRKFQQSVCLMTDISSGTEVCAYVSEITGDPITPIARFMDKDNKSISRVVDFHYRRPTCGYVPTNYGAVHLKRWMGEKNWHIGLTSANTKISCYGMAKDERTTEAHLLHCVKDVFHPDYTIIPDRQYNALSRLFLWDKDSEVIFGIHQTIVARFIQPNQLTLRNPAYKQELQDIINRRKLPWQISEK